MSTLSPSTVTLTIADWGRLDGGSATMTLPEGTTVFRYGEHASTGHLPVDFTDSSTNKTVSLNPGGRVTYSNTHGLVEFEHVTSRGKTYTASTATTG
jgi:hypothetical protein